MPDQQPHRMGPRPPTFSLTGAFPDIGYAGKWFVFAVVIGVIAGLVAVVFFTVLHEAVIFFSHTLARFHPPLPGGDPPLPDPSPLQEPIWWMILLVPALGGLIAGVLVHLLKPDAERGGTDAVLKAFHEHRGRLGLATPVVKAIASVAVIGSGGSVGREGPMVSLGAALGSKVANALRLPAKERRIALLVGAAAGFASIFRAPLSGAIFAIESPYRNPEFEYAAFVPAIIGAVASYATFSFVYGFNPVFDVADFSVSGPLELLLYALFGLVCALAGIAYVWVLERARERVGDPVFQALRVPVFLRPAFGGLALGALVLCVPQVWGTGYGWVQQAFDGTLGGTTGRGVLLLFGLALAKLLATAITYGSRGGEGVFGPAFYVGALLGAGYGQLAHRFFPEVAVEPGAYALVGMSGLFAGITKVPIAGLVMVCEISGSYKLLLPLVLVCSISYVFTGRASIYRAQVASRFDSPAHLGEFSVDVLGNLVVRDAVRRGAPPPTVANTAPVADVLKWIAQSRNTTFPVVDAEGFVTGVVTVEDVRELLLETGLHRLVLVDEVASRDFPTVQLDDPLSLALKKISAAEVEQIPVVELRDGRPRLVGLLSREEIFRLYRDRMDLMARGGADAETKTFVPPPGDRRV